MSWIASRLDFHRGGARETLDACVVAAVPALRQDAHTLLGWEVELKQRRRRRRA